MGQSTQSSLNHSRSISLTVATSVVVANMIGTGVYTSLGFQVAAIPSPWAILFLWVVGAIYAAAGAMSYGELAARIPGEGGEYTFLSRVFHPALGFASGFVSLIAGFSASIAATSITMGQYLHNFVPLFDPTLTALSGIVIISLIHSFGFHWGGPFQFYTTVLKVFLIVAFIFAGLAMGPMTSNLSVPSFSDFTLVFSPAFAVSMVYVTFSYSGWNASVYLADVIKDPETSLAKSLLRGTIIVSILYVLLNLVFLRTVPLGELKNQLDVGFISATHIFGTDGARGMALVIAIGLISTISSMVFAGPRVSVAMARDLKLFSWAAQKSATGTPIVAIWVQAALALTMAATARFDQIITYLGFSLSLFSLLSVAGLFFLPKSAKPTPLGSKSWFFPWIPTLFILINTWMIIFVVAERPKEALAGLLTILISMPLFYFGRTRTSGVVS